MEDRNNLQDFQRKVSLYFDNALNKEDEQTLLNKVNQDPSFSRVFDKEKNIRDYIKAKVRRPIASPDLIQSIKDKVRFQ